MPSLITSLRKLFLSTSPAPTTARSAEEAESPKIQPLPNSPRVNAIFPGTVSGNDMGVATVYRCVKLLSEKVACLPIQMQLRQGDIFVPTPDYIADLLNTEPDRNTGRFELVAQIVRDIYTKGNSYCVPVYDEFTGQLLRMAYVASGGYDMTSDTYTISDLAAGITGTFDYRQICHFRNFGRNPKMGVSTLEYARTTCDIAKAGDTETKNRIQNGGDVRGIVGNDTSARGMGEYSDDFLEETAVDIDGAFRSGQRIVPLPGQVEFKQISLSSADLQFLQTRQFTVREICRMFGVPPSFVYDDTSNNYKSAEMANTDLMTNTIEPLLSRIEEEFTRKLIPRHLWGVQRLHFDRNYIDACDHESEARYLTTMINNGVMTPNEGRKRAGFLPVEGGDKLRISANTKPIDENEQQ